VCKFFVGLNIFGGTEPVNLRAFSNSYFDFLGLVYLHLAKRSDRYTLAGKAGWENDWSYAKMDLSNSQLKNQYITKILRNYLINYFFIPFDFQTI
jgi:hypothetical protein